MKPKWQRLASLAQEICTLLFQFFGAVFASKGYPFKNISNCSCVLACVADYQHSQQYFSYPICHKDDDPSEMLHL